MLQNFKGLPPWGPWGFPKEWEPSRPALCLNGQSRPFPSPRELLPRQGGGGVQLLRPGHRDGLLRSESGPFQEAHPCHGLPGGGLWAQSSPGAQCTGGIWGTTGKGKALPGKINFGKNFVRNPGSVFLQGFFASGHNFFPLFLINFILSSTKKYKP